MRHVIKFWVSVLCTVMMAGMLAFAAEPPAKKNDVQPGHLGRQHYEKLYVKTEGGNLNVRAGAGTEYRIVGKLANGTEILGWSIFGEIDSEGYSWMNIGAIGIDGKEVSGWVRDDYLSPDPPARSAMIGIGPDVG